MRIALLQEERFRPSLTGGSKCSRRLLEALARDGYTCLALAPAWPAADGAGASPEAGVETTVHGHGVALEPLPAEHGQRHDFVLARLAAFRPDVVLVSADPRYYLLEAALAAFPERVVFVVHSHEHVPFGPFSRRPDDGQWRLLRRARAVLAVSEFSREYLLHHGGIEARVVRFPVFGQGPFARLGDAAGRITQISLEATKGGALFLALARALPELPFAAIHRGAPEPLLAELAACANVRLLEPVDDIESVLRAASLLLMPSLLPETLGLAALEAMLHGIPTLASALGGLPEATGGGATLLPLRPTRAKDGGFEIPEQDPTPWARAVRELLADPAHYSEASRRARAAAGRFVSEISTRPFEVLFREIAGGTAAPVAVVDPYDAGFLLARELGERGVPVVGVESSPHVAAEIRAKCERDALHALVRHGGDVEATAKRLEALGVTEVLPGCEPGVPLADALAEALGARGNGSALSMARRDKFLMAERARLAGIPVPRQCRATSHERALAWTREHAHWPVIAKPPHSLASEDVHVCRDEHELGRAAQRILSRRNLCGLVNESVLVQELVDGTQYVVDTLSRDGRHSLSAVWRYGRPAFAPALLAWARGNGPWPAELAQLSWAEVHYAAVGNDSKWTAPGDDELAAELFAYACHVLDALGIRHGPAHFELMWAGGEPWLIEVGARLHGGPNTHWMSRITSGASQLDGLIDLTLEPALFARHERHAVPLRWHGANIRLHPWRAGWFAGLHGRERLERLPSFRRLFYPAAPSEIAPLDCVGVVALVHPDEEVVREDAAAIRALERQDLFDLTPRLVEALR